MPPRTAWSNQGSSRVASDRIRPSRSESSTPPHGSRGKRKNKDPQPAQKSEEVKRLEALEQALRTQTGLQRNLKASCFCQAREHGLSSYAPICRACGLILCTLNLPHFACPHCSSALLSPVARESLVKELSIQISETLAREAQERERTAEDARKAVGAFPPLAPGSVLSSGQLTSEASAQRSSNQAHKVLSIDRKTKNVLISSYSPTPAPSHPLSRVETETIEPHRMPPPSSEVSYVKNKLDPNRPWANLGGVTVHYVALSRSNEEEAVAGKRTEKRKNKGKVKEVEVVPGN